jgi:hypothetical protein
LKIRKNFITFALGGSYDRKNIYEIDQGGLGEGAVIDEIVKLLLRHSTE